jgi:hypothetical protein
MEEVEVSGAGIFPLVSCCLLVSMPRRGGYGTGKADMLACLPRQNPMGGMYFRRAVCSALNRRNSYR